MEQVAKASNVAVALVHLAQASEHVHEQVKHVPPQSIFAPAHSRNPFLCHAEAVSAWRLTTPSSSNAFLLTTILFAPVNCLLSTFYPTGQRSDGQLVEHDTCHAIDSSLGLAVLDTCHAIENPQPEVTVGWHLASLR